jgi:D-alanyl-D-alanine carboxypeptidase
MGLANLETGTPIEHGMRLRAASISKTMVAAAVLKLVDRAELKLTDTVGKWLPTIRHSEIMTIRHLLDHTSGLRDYIDSDEYRSAPPDMPWPHYKPLQVGTALPPAFEPGHDFAYSNTNYHVLGTIVELITKQRLGEWLVESVLAPVGLDAISIDDGHGFRTDVTPYVGSEEGDSWVDVSALYYSDASLCRSACWADGAACATPLHLARWAKALLATPSKILSTVTLSDMVRNAQEDGEGNGLGIFGSVTHDIGLRLSHSGGVDGYTSHMAYYPAIDTSVVIMTNSTVEILDSGMDKLADVIAALIAQ